MATYNVVADDDGIMTVRLGLETTASHSTSLPYEKAMARVTNTEYNLPREIQRTIRKHVQLHERCLTRTLYNCFAIICCTVPYACCETKTWNPDRDPDLIRIEVQRLFNAEGIAPEDYRIVEYVGTNEKFTKGRVVLKIHFNQPGVYEL